MTAQIITRMRQIFNQISCSEILNAAGSVVSYRALLIINADERWSLVK